MDSQDKNNTPTLTQPNYPSYEQLYTLLSRATDCIKASNERIATLEDKVTTLEKKVTSLDNLNLYILSEDAQADTGDIQSPTTN